MKKLSALLLAILMCLSCMPLAGCGSDKGESKQEITGVTKATAEASTEEIKQAVMDFYNSKPFSNAWYYREDTVSVANDDWVFDEIKETEKNKFRVSGTYNEYECDEYGNRFPYPRDDSFDHYVTYYPETGNYDVTYAW